jgi:ferredoxin
MAEEDGCMRITIDRSRCVGAGQCVLTDADIFDQSDEDGKVLLVTQPGADTEDTIRRAVMLCPSGALGLSDARYTDVAGGPR